MITGEIKSQIDGAWTDFWSGGISNPLEVIEQLAYLLFVKGLMRLGWRVGPTAATNLRALSSRAQNPW